MPSTHLVTKGDNLTSMTLIALHYDVSFKDLIEANKHHRNIANRKRQDEVWGYIDIGDQINIPQQTGNHSNVFDHSPVDQICVHCPERDPFELYWVANCSDIPKQSFLLFDQKQAEAIKIEEDQWDKLIGEMDRAYETQDEEAITAAKNLVAKALTGLVEGPGTSKLTEIRRLNGKKVTYVRSKKLKSHTRSYSLASDDKKRSLLDKEGKLDKKKLQQRFGQISGELKAAWTTQADLFETWVPSWDDKIDDWNKSLHWSSSKDIADEEVNFDLSADAQLMRFYAGASTSLTFAAKEKRFGLKGQAYATVALAEGKASFTGYFPNKAGHRVILDNNGHPVNFGSFRGSLAFTLTGFAGVSALGAISLEIGENGTVKGGDKPKTKKNNLHDAPISVSGELFVGAKAGGELMGTIDWDNPDSRGSGGQPAWKLLLRIGFSVSGAAGLGVELSFKIGLNDKGQFIWRCKGGVVLGLGGSGMLAGVIDGNAIWELYQFVYRKLLSVKFKKLDFIDDMAFEKLLQIGVWAISEGKEMANYVVYFKEGHSNILRWWEQRKANKDSAESLAKRINKAPQTVRYTSPEAKGSMLYILTQTFVLSAEVAQEQAIIEILTWVQTQEEYDKLCERMTIDGSKGITDAGKHYGHNKIMKILDRSRQISFDKMQQRWKQKSNQQLADIPLTPTLYA